MLYYRVLLHVKIKIWKSTLKLVFFCWMKDPTEMLTSFKNQVCTPHKSRVTYNLNSHSYCMFYYRAVMDVKVEI